MMAHYAFLNENNEVTEVIVGVDENVTQTDLDGTEVGGTTEAWETFYSNFRGQTCKRTSFNAFKGKKRNLETGETIEEDGFRKNYAGIGMIYDQTRDAFIFPQPYPSWQFNETTYDWHSPVAKPDLENDYNWNEATLSWDIDNK